MPEDYLKGKSDEEVQDIFNILSSIPSYPPDSVENSIIRALTKIPKNKIALYTTYNPEEDKTTEYLINKDGELVTTNKLSSLEQMKALRMENSSGKIGFIEYPLFIPVGYRIHFFAIDGEDNDPTNAKPYKTDPIMSKIILTEEEAKEYLYALELN